MGCFSCGNRNANQVRDLFGYIVCSQCEKEIGLYKDPTIIKAIKSYAKKKESIPENPTYAEDVDYRLSAMEDRYIRQRIKLLHIQSRISELENQ